MCINESNIMLKLLFFQWITASFIGKPQWYDWAFIPCNVKLARKVWRLPESVDRVSEWVSEWVSDANSAIFPL